jgi:hypothetical protein
MELDTLQQTKDYITSEAKTGLQELSKSSHAEHTLWINIIAMSVWIFNKLLDMFTTKTEAMIKEQKMFLIPWYIEMIKSFQLNHKLRQNDDGTTGYDIIDPKARIIKHVSIRETTDGLSIKVAKEVDGELCGLNKSTNEFLQFKYYVEARKAPGTKINYVTLDADLLLYNIDVYIDALYVSSSSNNTVSNNVKAALTVYRDNLNYEGIVYVSELERSIIDAAGVITAKVKSISGKQGDMTESFDVKYILKSGYFNYDPNSTINIIQNDN